MTDDPVVPRPGDIALVSGGGLRNRILAALQNAARLGKYKSQGVSHVLLCMTGEIWFHATPPTVRLVLGREAFGPGSRLRS